MGPTPAFATRTDEIADGIFRFSTCIPDITPGGFTFNQYLVTADQPLLYHTGMRGLFPLVSAAVRAVVPLEKLRWISFSHIEADECGALNDWLRGCPAATALHSRLGCDLSVRDLAERPPKAHEDNEVLDLGGKRVRLLMTPHVPHNWESIVLFEETTRTLLCGDILTTAGDGPAVVETDLAEKIVEAERMFHAWSRSPGTGAVLDRLAALEPRTLAAMHGSAYRGDGAKLLRSIRAGIATP
jgi:flavorubredoxin